jgi:hypothetical protein
MNQKEIHMNAFLRLAMLSTTAVLVITGSASAAEARDEAAVRALGDGFAKAFVQKSGLSDTLPKVGLAHDAGSIPILFYERGGNWIAHVADAVLQYRTHGERRIHDSEVLRLQTVG